MRIQIGEHFEISRLIKGGWQLAGGHGLLDTQQALRDMAAYVEAGITTFDCADIYTGVEQLIGQFRARMPHLAKLLQINTKLVPDLATLDSLSAANIESLIDRSLQRLQVEQLDLVQFHWWDYDVPRYVEAATELARLRTKGKLAHIGVTNFDTRHLKELLDAGIPVISNQLQYSLLDQRPAGAMTELCRERNVALLCYGTVAGGFLSERWLNQAMPGRELTNRSLIKYRLIIEEFGGWDLFQELLLTLREIAVLHACDIATVAARAALDRDMVAAVIIGATNASHLPDQLKIAGLKLTAADLDSIEAILRRRRGPTGDVFTLERDRTGPHGRIMKYNLSRET